MVFEQRIVKLRIFAVLKEKRIWKGKPEIPN